MVMTTLIDIDGSLGWVLMLLPMAVLAVVLVGVVVGRDRLAREAAPFDHEPAVATPQGAAPPTFPPPTTASPGTQVNPKSETTIATPPASDAAARPAPPPEGKPWGGVERPAGRAVLEARLMEAEDRFDDAAVARLSLQLARELIGAGAPGHDVQTHLRRAIILATRLKDDETHAAARLELGDILSEEGDKTTACEHWQIARQIFWDAKAKQPLADVDRRMIANGCPTDWVLNDF